MEFPGHFVNVTRFVLEGERGGPGAGREALNERQIADQFIRQAVGEIIVRRIVTQIVERQNRDRQWLGEMLAPPEQTNHRDYKNGGYSSRQHPAMCETPSYRLLQIARGSQNDRNVAAPWDLDQHRVALALSQIVVAQP